MTLSIQITKFKFRQYQQRVISPNLMLAKIIRYTVYQPPQSQEKILWGTRPFTKRKGVVTSLECEHVQSNYSVVSCVDVFMCSTKILFTMCALMVAQANKTVDY